jgi:ferredoxin
MSILVNWLESLHEEMKVSAKCVRGRNLKSTCSYCFEKCEHEAIVVKGNVPLIDINKCTMCGDCMIACPVSAIEGAVNNRAFDKASLVFDQNYVPSIKELLIYKKRGITSIQVSHQPLTEDWKTVINQTNSQLQMLDETPIEILQKVREEQVLSRRAFFGTFQKEGKQLAKSMAPAAWKMERDDWKLTKYYPDYQFFSVKLHKEECTLCQACFTLCPENVFTITEGIQLHSEKCVNCTSCVDVCPEHAIEIQTDVIRNIEQVEQVHSKYCIGCGHSFYTFHSETEKCHVCINRDPDWLSPY